MASGILKRGNPAPPSAPAKRVEGGLQRKDSLGKARINPTRRSDPAKRDGRVG